MWTLKLLLAFASCLIVSSEEIKQYGSESEIYRCLECLCHARSGCYNRINCARYSISFDYWKTAGSPVLNADDSRQSKASYEKCMQNEMCIMNTIVQYADAIRHMDCNCDGDFDCKDRFAIHLFGRNCTNPVFGSKYAKRFNKCSRSRNLDLSLMENQEGSDDCDPEEFV